MMEVPPRIASREGEVVGRGEGGEWEQADAGQAD